jgi:hypothetical protein
MAGLENFKRGCIWRIGDGTQVNIWEDKWIPTSPTCKLATPRGNIVITKVSILIYPISGFWDEELRRSIFWEVDVNRIMEIPIAPADMEDFVA